MKMKTLTSAILLSTLPVTGAFAAAMDRSGQSISAFLQPGNYAEAGISILDANVSGVEAGETTTRRNIEDMADSYYFPSAAIKVQPHERFSLGLIYDQPFGAAASYSGENAFVSNYGNDTVLGQPTFNNMIKDKVKAGLTTAGAFDDFNNAALGGNYDAASPSQIRQALIGTATQIEAAVAALPDGNATKIAQLAKAQGLRGAANQIGNALGTSSLLGQGQTKVDLHSENLSLIFGFQPTENWNFYAGPVFQTVKGDISLRGQAYSIFNGYDAKLSKTEGYGWLAGAAFQIPEIALKASITYRSEIDHESTAQENISGLDALSLVIDNPAAASATINGIRNATGESKFTSPQSVNLDLQSGIMANTVAFLNLRWVDWSSFALRPLQFGKLSEVLGQLPVVNRQDGFDIVKYDKDQISATAGVGRKFSEQWAGNVSVGWDSGAGNPITTLGPTDGYWNVGVGLQFSPTPQTFIAGGVKYFKLGDAESQTAAQVGEDNRIVAKFEDNDAIAYGLKIGYRF